MLVQISSTVVNVCPFTSTKNEVNNMARKKKDEISNNTGADVVDPLERELSNNQRNSFRNLLKNADSIVLGQIPNSGKKFTEDIVKEAFLTFRHNSTLNDKQLTKDKEFYMKKIDDIDRQLADTEQKLTVEERREIKQEQKNLFKLYSECSEQGRATNNISNKQIAGLIGLGVLAVGGVAITQKNKS